MTGPSFQLLRSMAHDLEHFTEEGSGLRLRRYQLEAAQAVLDSIRQRRGDSIVVMMSRQAGKDELSANLKAYLLARFALYDASIVEINPTYQPQTVSALDRLDRRLETNQLTRDLWRKHSEFVRTFYRSRVTFLSGEPGANIVGATASLLLIVNEAQDIRPAIYDRKIAPMAASTNATRLLMGTAWMRDTLLGRELRLALQAEQADGRRRVFRYDADDVRSEAPAYGAYVDGEIQRLGRGHPLVRTQYFNEEIDAQLGMFGPARRALIFAPAEPAAPGRAPCAFCIDVAGMDEASTLAPLADEAVNPRRDATTLSIVQLELSAAGEPGGGPRYSVVRRCAWTGANHLAVFGQLRALAQSWRPEYIVVDATGVGEGLWAMLDRAFPGRVLPVKFSASSKSEIGYRFLAIIESGRFQDRSAGDAAGDGILRAPSRLEVERAYAACQASVLVGPQRLMRWGVPDGTRDESGGLLHDDVILADALVAVLDQLSWSPRFETIIIPGRDPLDEMSRFHAG